ncbi:MULTISPECIES: TetR/AcrR family transcriptional regulator [Cyanophyceae]|uniref:TetR/AcrR family transcriptional regulator n=1 Tax=Cyanophyceae TaxID=3028117 RepID=UPI0002A66769|nr:MULTISPECIES: TetR/AcrR family transcriptional regulator [Cyanophyceae]AFZ33475.1 transcriptional regulator, TetR family [Gloeocapsa sp. PCC 7428]PPS41985.1 TetR family transcriptional regulator [Chroococcidiopsis sp. TS-821]
MPRNKTITDEEILAVARSLFIKEGAKASTRTLAKMVGISEAVIFQRFGTKEELFFAAMVLPEAQLEVMFNVQPGKKQVTTNLKLISLQIVSYFREVMPVFLSLISHPSFNMQTFLQHHTMPAMQIGNELTEYLTAELNLGRIYTDNAAVTATVLLSHLHNLVLSETIGAHQPIDTDRAISDAIAVLWNGLAP